MFTPTLYVVKTQPPPAVRTPTPTVPTPSTPAFPCQERQVSAWLDKHGVYGGQLDYSIYDDKVDWIVNGKLSAKTRSEIVKDEEDFRKVYPVQKYTAQTSSTAIVRGECVLTQLLNSYKRSSNGKGRVQHLQSRVCHKQQRQWAAYSRAADRSVAPPDNGPPLSAITVLLDVKDIPQVGPLQWGRITDSPDFSLCRQSAMKKILRTPS